MLWLYQRHAHKALRASVGDEEGHIIALFKYGSDFCDTHNSFAKKDSRLSKLRDDLFRLISLPEFWARFGGQVMGPQLFKSLFQTFNVLLHYA